MDWRALNKKLEELERRERQWSTSNSRVLQATRDAYTGVTEHADGPSPAAGPALALPTDDARDGDRTMGADQARTANDKTKH